VRSPYPATPKRIAGVSKDELDEAMKWVGGLDGPAVIRDCSSENPLRRKSLSRSFCEDP
jgi:hypothetical protein